MRDSSGKFIQGHPSTITAISRKKIIDRLKGLKKSQQTRDRLSKALKGRKLSPEHKEKLSLVRKGVKDSPAQIERKRGNKYALGHKKSDEAKDKIRKGHIGLKVSKETLAKMSSAQFARWDRIGRKTYEKRYIHIRDKKYLDWRTGVFTRDNWTCQTCSIRGVYLEAHHVKSWASFPECRYELSNGITLCKPCHTLTDNYKNKK